MQKSNTHVVLKKEDIDKYLSEENKISFGLILERISVAREQDGKKAINNYYICNTDEPYADKVLQTIIDGEKSKRK